MTSNDNNEPNGSTQTTDSTGQIEFLGRKFDKTPEGEAQFREFEAKLAKMIGSQSNEVGQARKTIAKYQRMVEELPEPIRVILQSEEASPEAKILANYIAQDTQKKSERSDISRRDQWYADVSESVLEELPELKEQYDVDVIDAVLRKHSIHDSEDPLGDARKILSGKVKKKAAPSSASSQANVSVDGSSQSAPRGTQEKKTEPDSSGDFFAALGIK